MSLVSLVVLGSLVSLVVLCSLVCQVLLVMLVSLLFPLYLFYPLPRCLRHLQLSSLPSPFSLLLFLFLQLQLLFIQLLFTTTFFCCPYLSFSYTFSFFSELYPLLCSTCSMLRLHNNCWLMRIHRIMTSLVERNHFMRTSKTLRHGAVAQQVTMGQE